MPRDGKAYLQRVMAEASRTRIMLLSGDARASAQETADKLADATGTQVVRVDLEDVVSKYLGETEKNLDAVFKDAAALGAVLLVDEADALFGKRTDVKDSHDRYANIDTSALLQRIEEHPGAVVLATNLPPAAGVTLKRRQLVVD